MITPLKTKVEMRNAKLVLWWVLVGEFIYAKLSLIGLSYFAFMLFSVAFSVLLIIFYYIIFLGFSKMAKYFHSMNLFWLFFLQFISSILFVVIDVYEQLFYYGIYNPASQYMSFIILLTIATFTFAYGYFIMELPWKKFEYTLYRIRISNITKAFLTVAVAYSSVVPRDNELTTSLYPYTLLAYFVFIFITTYYDYRLISTALRLVGGVKLVDTPISRGRYL